MCVYFFSDIMEESSGPNFSLKCRRRVIQGTENRPPLFAGCARPTPTTASKSSRKGARKFACLKRSPSACPCW